MKGAARGLVYLCAPNNPTGLAWPIPEIAAVVRRCPDALFVVDQSFLSLSERHEDAAVGLPDNAVRVRSLTKDHAHPGRARRRGHRGARLAKSWSDCGPRGAPAPRPRPPPSPPPRSKRFVAESRARLLADRAALSDGLTALADSHRFPRRRSSFCCAWGMPGVCAGACFGEHGILVRDCASFGLPDHVRLAARPAADRERLLTALGSVRTRGPGRREPLGGGGLFAGRAVAKHQIRYSPAANQHHVALSGSRTRPGRTQAWRPIRDGGRSGHSSRAPLAGGRWRRRGAGSFRAWRHDQLEKEYLAEKDEKKRAALVAKMTWLPGAPEVLHRIAATDPVR